MLKIFPKFSEQQIKEINSRAEQRFYRACRDQLGPEWLVLHSIPYIVNLSGSPKDGEADFVVFSPSKGFLVIEIKGGEIEYDPESGKWTSKDFNGISHLLKMSPFLQGLKEKKAILEQLQTHSSWPSLNISYLNCGHAVFLPDIDNIQPLVMSASPREIIGGRADLQNLESWINKVFSYWQGSQHNSQTLGSNGLKIVEQIFCTKRKVRPLLSAQIEVEEEQRINLTEQQSSILRFIENRKKALISGGAGTGKTILAVDRASQLAKSGMKTLLLCYNHPLAEHLKDVVGDNPNLLPMDFHQLCEWRIKQVLSKVGLDLKAEAKQAYPNHNFFDVQLPYALALSTESLPNERFDAIIVDEGQDFKENYWMPLEMLLRDEKKSYLYIFLDFNQALYQQNTRLPINEDPFSLTVNCRNTKYIHEAAYHFYRGNPVDPPDNEGVPVETHLQETLPGQVDKLHSFVSSLISKEKVEPKDIVILVAGHVKEIYYKELRPLTLPRGMKYSIEAHRVPNTVLVDTVGRFKGLESNVVILWGLDEFDPLQDKEDLYVAFSRAKSRLHLFGTQAACQRALETRF